MRVLQVSPTCFSAASVIGGVERYVTYLMRALALAAGRVGVQVEQRLIAPGALAGLTPIDYGGVCQVLGGDPWNPGTIDVAALRQHVHWADCVIAHQGLTATGMFVASHASLQGKIVVAMDHGGGEHRLVQRTPEAGRVFDFAVAQSEFAAASFRDLDVPIEIIPGPVDTVRYRPSGTVAREHGLVLALGRLLPHKGFERVIRALPSECRLVLAGTRGDAAYFDFLTSCIEGLGAKVAIREGLADAEILNLMQSCAVFVHASTHHDYSGRFHPKPELLGLAPLEAMACGAPTLVSVAGALAELAAIPGCREFSDEEALRVLMRETVRANWGECHAVALHRATEQRFGLETFGSRLLARLREACACRGLSSEVRVGVRDLACEF